MNREEAIQKFYSSFGIPAFDETTVPDEDENGNKIVPPYITYPVEIGSFDRPVIVQPSIWYSGMSWAAITQKAMQIIDGIDGHTIKYDNGAILLFAGSPKYQRVDSGADNVRRIVLNIQMEFLEV